MDKPFGPTSHDIVAHARRVLRTRRVGHAGTLDPAATGVLVLVVGEGTKLSPYLTAHSKRYAAEVRLGVSTTTDDAQGEIMESPCQPIAPSRDALEAALELERHRTQQVPPQFSAIKIGGRASHQRARAGEELVLEARHVKVEHLMITEGAGLSWHFELLVSKGYYVRSFARDLGKALGIPAHLAALRRIASGPFTLEDALAWPPTTAPLPLSLAQAATRALEHAVLMGPAVLKARQGKRLEHSEFSVPPRDASPHAWLSPEGTLVAIGGTTADGLRVLRGFTEAPADN